MNSPTFFQAVEIWRRIRDDYEEYRVNAFERAQEATKGYLLNPRGKKAGIDAYSLFMGPQVRAEAYASRELLDHWEQYPRVTFAQYERQVTERNYQE